MVAHAMDLRRRNHSRSIRRAQSRACLCTGMDFRIWDTVGHRSGYLRADNALPRHGAGHVRRIGILRIVRHPDSTDLPR